MAHCRPRARRCWIVALTLLWGGTAAAWSPAGHMVTGAMTFELLARLDPAALDGVIELLRQHPHHDGLLTALDDSLDADERRVALLMQGARWADDVRSPPWDEYSEPTWHYVNFRYQAPDLRPPRSPQRDGFLLWALDENTRRLASESAQVRAVALTWLLHLVGDLHMPLHDIAVIDGARPDGDRGGNLTFVRSAADARTVNLHWLWDGLLIDTGEFSAARDRSTALLHTYAAAIAGPGATAGAVDFRSWAEEGARIAVTSGYLDGTLGTGTSEDGLLLPPGYVDSVRPVAEQRAVIAAYRLARMLAERF